jgi:hypothetical protein
MDTLLSYYRTLFWSPGPIDSAGDYFIAVLTILPVWLFLWWIVALIARTIGGDLRLRAGTHTAIRLIWARCALILSALLLVDICLIWYFDNLSDWTAITPHATIACAGAVVALCTALILRSELNDNRRKLFAAMPKSNVAAAR